MKRIVIAVLGLLLAGACSTEGTPARDWDFLSFHWVADEELIDARICLLPGGQEIELEPEPLLDFSYVTSARVVEEDDGDFHVLLHLDSAGSARLREVTEGGVGRRLAIVVDRMVVSMPLVQRPIELNELPLMPSTFQAADELARRINDEAIARRVEET